MLSNREILDISRRYGRGEITLSEMGDTFEEHGVSLERYRRVLAIDLVKFIVKCGITIAIVWAASGSLAWLVGR